MAEKSPKPKSTQTVAEKKGYEIASTHRGNMNALLGKLLTIVESVLGETKQAEATKELVKHEVWRTTDDNQKETYDSLTGKSGLPVAMTSDGEMQ